MGKICLFFFLLTAIASFSQKSPSKFGDIPMEDMTMKFYPQDSSAAAVVLFDYGVAYISKRYDVSYMQEYYRYYFHVERHVRIKILKKEGLGHADVAVPLFQNGSSEEKLENLKAVTYNFENGKIVETQLSNDGVFKEKFNRNFNQAKFAFPNVKEGSVIEFSYIITSGFLANFPNWRFQRSIPTRLSEYWAMIPEFFFFEKYMQGYVPLSSYTAEKTNYHHEAVDAFHYVSKNVPAFKKEPNMTSEEDYVSKINFALSHFQFPGEALIDIMGSWDKLVELLRSSEYCGKAIKSSDFLKDDVEKILKDISDQELKVSALTNYVKKNFEWDGFSDYITFFPKKIFEKKKGSSGDLNLLLGSMLDKAGFEVEMVLLSTRDHGAIRMQYPMERQLNYVIVSVKIGDKILFLDATEKYLPFDVLPARCLNGKGLKIGPVYYNWVEIIPKAKEKTFVSASFAANESGELKGKLEYAADGYDAHDMRTEYFKKGEEKYKKDFLASRQWEVEKTEFKDLEDLSKTAKVSYQVTINEHATSSGDVIYLNPFVTQRSEENPFKSETREYPVDFGSRIEKIYSCNIKLPEGFAVDELPKSIVITLPENSARFTYNVSQLNDAINITSNFQINKSLFVQTEYAHLREFYNQVIAKQAEQIVLKKK